MKRYIKPEIDITLIHVQGELLGASQDIDTAVDGDSFAKGGTGSFEWDDFGEEEDLLDEDQF